jgi:hypothetical protein
LAPRNDDHLWRRPSGPQPEPSSAAPPGPLTPPYTGPPRSVPPPPGWKPRTLIQVPPPRDLPPQDLDRVEAAEQQGRTVTYGVGMIAGTILLIVLFVLCGRALL